MHTYIYIWTSIRAIILWSLKALSQRVLALLSGNSFYSSGHRDLDPWSTDPKSIGFFYDPKINRGLLLNKGHHLWSLKTLGQRVLIERKRSVTDGQTVRRTDGQGKTIQIQSCPTPKLGLELVEVLSHTVQTECVGLVVRQTAPATTMIWNWIELNWIEGLFDGNYNIFCNIFLHKTSEFLLCLL